MLHQFVASEFSKMSSKSWLRQFLEAYHWIGVNPTFALRSFVDKNLDRWKDIADNVDDIQKVAIAIEFLGQSLEECSKCSGCCGFRPRKIQATIQAAKTAAYPRRKRYIEGRIQEVNESLTVETAEKKRLTVAMAKIQDKFTPWVDAVRSQKKKDRKPSLLHRSNISRLRQELSRLTDQYTTCLRQLEHTRRSLHVLGRSLKTI
jgi:hypothetical protein